MSHEESFLLCHLSLCLSVCLHHCRINLHAAEQRNKGNIKINKRQHAFVAASWSANREQNMNQQKFRNVSKTLSEGRVIEERQLAAVRVLWLSGRKSSG